MKSVSSMSATPAPDRACASNRPRSAAQGRSRRKPTWLKAPLPGGEGYARLKGLTTDLTLNTVCEEARCPNIGECWAGERATMTLMVLGSECTRRCRFCAVKTVERAAPPDPREPVHVGTAVAALGPAYVVITSVDRDDLSDGGAAHYARCVEEIRRRAPETLVETLIPDYTGENLSLLMGGSPDVVAHNVEVVERLQRRVRDPRCSFTRSLDTLRGAKEQDAGVLTKSSLMLGLGERDDEVSDALERLRGADVDFLTLGQYLRPTANHAPVVRYVEPERFEEWRRVAYDLGFAGVASGPLVRSSYKAGELFAERIIEKRRGREWTQPERNDTP
ncbi:MAG: lipoyl synthase [Planctomycetota bacterium]|nr:lipoyl synthase [Planctomycetota bacterium]